MTVAIDTLKIYNRLRDAHVDEIAAREITEVFREITENNLSTKADLEKTKIELTTELEKVRVGLKADIEKVRIELETKIEKTKAEVIKWVAGMLVAQAAIVATLVKLLS